MRAVTKVRSLALLVLVPGNAVSYAQEMSMQEYKQQLAEWTERQVAAQAEYQRNLLDRDKLNSQIQEVDGQISVSWAQIYQEIGTTVAEVNTFHEYLNSLESQLNALGALSPLELFKLRKEIDAIEGQIGESKANRIAVLTEMRNKIAGIEGKIAQLRVRTPIGIWDEYTVGQDEDLRSIAAGPDVYNDAEQWVRIYSFNKDQIKDPKVVFPGQIFKIHRESGPDEYLVSRGDNLSKIAGSIDVMGDPTKWRALYEANKDVLDSLLEEKVESTTELPPYLVLRIPR